jgi:SAM-dependent methyltransferase
MLQRDHDIYASAPLRRLLDDQARALTSDLQRCFGTHALLIGVSSDDAPPALPMLGHWARLQAGVDGYCGDLRATTCEPLPFVDDAFELVVLRHALEVVSDASSLMAEAIRVLAPGGVLVVTGIHPLSVWAPWFYWHSRSGKPFLQTPLRLVHYLKQAGLDIELSRRVGRFWPVGTAPASRTNAFGGGYVLISRKRRRTVSPLRSRPVGMRVPANARLSPGTRRSSAS